MTINAQCRTCHQWFAAKEELAGKTILSPTCKQGVVEVLPATVEPTSPMQPTTGGDGFWDDLPSGSSEFGV